MRTSLCRNTRVKANQSPVFIQATVNCHSPEPVLGHWLAGCHSLYSVQRHCLSDCHWLSDTASDCQWLPVTVSACQWLSQWLSKLRTITRPLGHWLSVTNSGSLVTVNGCQWLSVAVQGPSVPLGTFMNVSDWRFNYQKLSHTFSDCTSWSEWLSVTVVWCQWVSEDKSHQWLPPGRLGTNTETLGLNT